MTPLDDELRRTLSSRAATVAPAADPLAGVEARASRIRRRRVSAAVAGAAAAVAAVALAVPGLLPERESGRAPQFAVTTTPSASPQPSRPAIYSTWAYRGNTLPTPTLDAFRSAWTSRHPGSTITPLFGQVFEPSAQQELVFAAQDGSEFGYRVGVIRMRPEGPEITYDEGQSWMSALAFVLPGDEGARLLVVAAPGSTGLSASSDVGKLPFTPLAELAPGVATGPVPADRPALMVRLTRPDGSRDDGEPYDNLHKPANVLDWPSRGEASVGPSVHDLGVAFTRALGRSDGKAVEYRPLFTSNTDSGVRYTVGQAWFRGDRAAHTVSYATGGTNGPAFFVGPVTPMNPTVLAFLVGSLPGTSVDELVVVPQPNTGQVLYDDDATGSFRPITGQDYRDGVVLIDRSKTATNDRLEVLDGHGDMDNPTYRGAVAALLCGLKECG